ncbi:DUF4233 domain-containing protein [uncultured Nocardioides sp.]|uniref:DUF4233 domain-containing protein n=1 Tax=uncultured Nocardioides sp. TaxID=198441 RepID=UPI0026298641|nr:DUF4233 domain-containing protein [uncultured Nocardioides sp.]
MSDATAPGDEARTPPQVPRAAQRSPRRGMCAAVLSLESIALALTTPVMVTLSDVPLGTALAVGLGLALVCILLAGALRAEWAYGVGYVVQAGALALGLVVPAMFFLGAVFAALWTAADLLGRKIERERAAAWAAYEARGGDGA